MRPKFLDQPTRAPCKWHGFRRRLICSQSTDIHRTATNNMKTKPKLLGIAASLRNARWGAGNEALINSLKGIKTEEELTAFLTAESELCLEHFIEAGRNEGKSFLEIYDNLKKKRGDSGLSNSEVALASALWSAMQLGVEADHISLSEYFLPTGRTKNIDELKSKLKESDGLLVSGPVYFGDRGSLAESLVELIRDDSDLRKNLEGKLYGGIAVGAKRNGGQETTLIYQMLDFINLGMPSVGNDSDTTAQYGGTGHAGDVGTMHKDKYGLNTSMGTGRRIASVMRRVADRYQVDGPVKVLFLILQDRAGEAERRLQEMLKPYGDSVDATIINVAEKRVLRCLACDVCPTHIDVDRVYRCIISSAQDDIKTFHELLLDNDAVAPVVYSGNDHSGIVSNYQQFVERTRYLRRGDYIFTNQLVAPIVFEELGSRENYHIRMMTSMIRHHTVMTRPIIAHLHKNECLNAEQVGAEFDEYLRLTRVYAGARLSECLDRGINKYNPVGYVLSAHKDAEDEKLNRRKAMLDDRRERLAREANERIVDGAPAALSNAS